MAGDRVRKVEVLQTLGRSHLLAESPGWNSSTGEYFWVDIMRRSLHWISPEGDGRTLHCPQGATSMKWIQGNRYFVTGEQSIFELTDLELTPLWENSDKDMSWRFNDSVQLPNGILVVGTKSEAGSKLPARVGHLERSNFCWWDVDLGLANGIAFDSVRSRLYICDSWEHKILYWDTDENGLPLDRANPICLVSEIEGEPDGLLLDDSGNLFVAVWGLGQIRIYSTEGFLRETHDTGLELTSSLAFASADKKDIVITSAAQMEIPRGKPRDLIGGEVVLARLN